MKQQIIQVLDFIREHKNNEIYKTVADFYKTEEGTLYRDNINTNIPNKIKNLIKSNSVFNIDDFKFDGSVGIGNISVVPHNAILYKNLTESTQNGVYIVLLYAADGSGVYLSFGQGATEIEEKVTDMIDISASELSHSLAAKYRDKLLKLGVKAKDYISDIDLKSKAKRPKSYEDANILAKYYIRENLDLLENDIIEMMNIYSKFIANNLYISDEKDVLVLADETYESYEQEEYRVGQRPPEKTYSNIERSLEGIQEAKNRKGNRAEKSARELFEDIFGKENVEDKSLVTCGYDIKIVNDEKFRGIEVKNISKKNQSCFYLSENEADQLQNGISRLLLVDHNHFYISKNIKDTVFLEEILISFKTNYRYDQDKWRSNPYSIESESIKVCFFNKDFYKDFVSISTLESNDLLNKQYLAEYLEID